MLLEVCVSMGAKLTFIIVDAIIALVLNRKSAIVAQGARLALATPLVVGKHTLAFVVALVWTPVKRAPLAGETVWTDNGHLGVFEAFCTWITGQLCCRLLLGRKLLLVRLELFLLLLLLLLLNLDGLS